MSSLAAAPLSEADRKARFGSRLRQLTLFGSRARGDALDESDADVLVVLDELTHADAKAMLDVASDVYFAHRLDVAPCMYDEKRYREHVSQERLLMLEIARDGVLL